MDANLLRWILGINVLYASSLASANSQTEEDLANICTRQVTCGQCISSSHLCAWCMEPDYDEDDKERCDYVENLRTKGCQQIYIVNPVSEGKFIKNVAPHDSERGNDAIQLAPQEVEVTIRPNRAYTLDVTFRQAKDYPVDLYYIMDLSNTMLKSKRQVANLGNELAIQMRNITANFRLGFGSYIDKNTSPYISIVPARLQDPCRTSVCVPTYSFKNHLPLTSDAQQFTDTVRDSRISGNLDTPEGTFDAIMQAVACKERIGWRAVSRKILLVSTDNIYHYAGDGKLAGIVRPNDGLCHLNDQNEYNMSLYQDYPSVSHLAQRVSEENVNIIFAIIDRLKALATYKPLTSLIRASVVVKLEEDSANIVDVIKENYKRISGKVELGHDAPRGVEVSYASSCLGDRLMNVSSCDGLKVRDSVTFRVTLNVTECPTEPKDRQKRVLIYPVGLSDNLVLRLNIDCSCACENSDFKRVGEIGPPEPNSFYCDTSGTYQCGVCQCDAGSYGKHCMCYQGSDEKCRRSPGAEICEGHGSCDCGSCVCDPLSAADPSKRYSGVYCECDDYSCDSYAGQLCGGKDRGVCVCGRCLCRPGYSGPSCACSLTTETCIGANQLVCSGHGVCICGQCQCDDRYQGRTCDICSSCLGQCEVNKVCVQCATFGTGPYSEAECAANCSHVNTVDVISKDDTEERLVCKFRDEDNCDFYFTYAYNTLEVLAQRRKECPKPVNKIGIILGVVGVITVIGIVLLVIWKVIITIYDKREYEKFLRERDAAKWQVDDNPIYKPSTSTFRNPAFAKVK